MKKVKEKNREVKEKQGERESAKVLKARRGLQKMEKRCKRGKGSKRTKKERGVLWKIRTKRGEMRD